jgi:hypothetical protein
VLSLTYLPFNFPDVFEQLIDEPIDVPQGDHLDWTIEPSYGDYRPMHVEIHLDNPNPWHDRLRAMLYDEAKGIYLIGTPEGIYEVDEQFEKQPHLFAHQAPISVMGINELSKLNEKEYLVGTFLGLFRWNPYDG